MYTEGKILIGMGENEVYIYPNMANRHGLIAGATGTGKTVTLKVMAESFSAAGVPVFLADVKGDLAATCLAGELSGKVAERVAQFNLESKGFKCTNRPVTFWDIYGEKGIPVRTTISEMGPIILGKVLGLTDTQKDILSIIFKIADDEGLALLDTKDLKAMLQHVSDNAANYRIQYGNMSPQSLGVLVRAVVALEGQGGEIFFGEPALNVTDWIRTDANGQGMISILDCQTLINNPQMYTAFMLWMMTELFEELPEVGDMDKPRMVFFFDEAHLLFKDCDKVLLEKIEQVVKLIRSKGVGIYFITQSPKDIPDGVLAQLGNKIQHALRAYTPAEQKAIKAVADSFRPNPAFKTIDVIQELGVGEAIISVLDEAGVPTVVERAHILPPESKMGPIDDATRSTKIAQSEFELKYRNAVDNESAYEILVLKCQQSNIAGQLQEASAPEQVQQEAGYVQTEGKVEQNVGANQIEQPQMAQTSQIQSLQEQLKAQQEANKARQAELQAQLKKEKAQNTAVKKAVKSTATTAMGTIGRELGKNVGSSMGGAFGKTLGGNVGASMFRGIVGTLLK